MSKLSELENELADLFKSNLDAEKLFYLGIQIGRELERNSITTGRDREPEIRQWFVNAGLTAYADPNTPINPRDAAIFYSGNSRNATGKISDSFVMTRIKLVYHLMPAVKCPPLR